MAAGGNGKVFRECLDQFILLILSFLYKHRVLCYKGLFKKESRRVSKYLIEILSDRKIAICHGLINSFVSLLVQNINSSVCRMAS